MTFFHDSVTHGYHDTYRSSTTPQKPASVSKLLQKFMVWKLLRKFLEIFGSAGMSPTLWTRGLAALGLVGTRGLSSPIEELPSITY